MKTLIMVKQDQQIRLNVSYNYAIRTDVNNQVNGLRSEMNSKLDLLIKMNTDRKPN